jgi:hypothetical protein
VKTKIADPPEYCLRTSYFWLGLLSMSFFVGMLAFSAFVLYTAASNPGQIAVAWFSIAFWSGWCCLSLWLITASMRERLRIDEAGIWQRGVLFQSTIPWSEVAALDWYTRPAGGSAVVRAKHCKITIHFANFASNASVQMIQQLRDHVSPKLQANWERFCFRIALPRRTGEPALGIDEVEDVIRYRSSWDWLFLPVLLVFGLASAYLAVAARMPHLYLIPVGLIAMWMLVRYSIPKEGRKVRVRKIQPAQVNFIRHLIAWGLLLLVALVAVKFLCPPNWQDRFMVAVLCCGYLGIFTCIGIGIRQQLQQEAEADRTGGPHAVVKWNLLEQRESQPL